VARREPHPVVNRPHVPPISTQKNRARRNRHDDQCGKYRQCRCVNMGSRKQPAAAIRMATITPIRAFQTARSALTAETRHSSRWTEAPADRPAAMFAAAQPNNSRIGVDRTTAVVAANFLCGPKCNCRQKQNQFAINEESAAGIKHTGSAVFFRHKEFGREAKPPGTNTNTESPLLIPAPPSNWQTKTVDNDDWCHYAATFLPVGSVRPAFNS